jgi:nucleoside-diphosphate-sugar epimerase
MSNISIGFEYFRPMILVTGGTGLLGSHLLMHLLKKGEHVKAIYRDPNSIKEVEDLFSFYSEDSGLFNKIIWVQADITDIPSLEKAFDGVTHVYHTAALISFNPAAWDNLQKINVEGTANIVNFCLAKKISKLCYVSSIAAIGKSTNNEMVSEINDWIDSDANVYSISKHDAEMEVWRGSQEGLNVVIVNPGVILGPGNWNRGSGRLFKNAARGMRSYFPGGTGFITVYDVVKIMIDLMNSNIVNERFITVAENLSYKEIFSRISVSLGLAVPYKKIPLWVLEFLWRLDWLGHTLFGMKRKLTKVTVKSLRNRQTYSHKKVIEALQYKFEDLGPCIDLTCKFLKIKYPKEF